MKDSKKLGSQRKQVVKAWQPIEKQIEVTKPVKQEPHEVAQDNHETTPWQEVSRASTSRSRGKAPLHE